MSSKELAEQGILARMVSDIPLTATSPTPDVLDIDRRVALMYRILAMLLFSVMSTFIKILSHLPTTEIAFFRCFFTWFPLLLWLLATGKINFLRTKSLSSHFFRGIFGVCSMLISFYALRELHVAEIHALIMASPVFATLLAVPLLREKLSGFKFLGVLVGFLGVVVMVQPGAAGFQTAMLWMVFSAVLHALAMVMVRRLTFTERSEAIVFYFMLITSSLCLFGLLEGWVWPSWKETALLVFMGVSGLFGQLCLVSSYRRASVASFAVIDYSTVLWASLWSYLFWDFIPELSMWLGVGLIVLSQFPVFWSALMRRKKPAVST